MALHRHECWMAVCGHCLKEEIAVLVRPPGHSRPWSHTGPPAGWKVEYVSMLGWRWEEVWCRDCVTTGHIGDLHASLIPEPAPGWKGDAA